MRDIAQLASGISNSAAVAHLRVVKEVDAAPHAERYQLIHGCLICERAPKRCPGTEAQRRDLQTCPPHGPVLHRSIALADTVRGADAPRGSAGHDVILLPHRLLLCTQ